MPSPLHVLHALALTTFGVVAAGSSLPRTVSIGELQLRSEPAQQTPVVAEPVLRVDLLDNGSFDEPADDAEDEHGMHPVPWWRTSHGAAQLTLDATRACLVTRAEQWAEQPIAAYAPLAGELEITGELSGRGRIVIVDGKDARAVFEPAGEGWRAFKIEGSELARRLGHSPQPRFLLRLEALDAGEARWRGLHAAVALPCPGEDELRAEIRECLRRIVAPWLEHALDREGPRKTNFVVHLVDAVSGEAISTFPGGFYPLWEQLWDAVQVADEPEWKTAVERYVEDYLELGLDPGTGLPRMWDAVRDVPVDDKPVEIARPLAFLIDVAEEGPENLRARARAAALKIGETVLAKGILPDGSVGASYFPATAAVNTGVVALRRFDVPAQLARLSKLSGDARYLHAAGEALGVFEFTHAWSGVWWKIDPAFDDEFGHYGARAVTIAGCAPADMHSPTDTLFLRFALEAWKHFAPLWRDALRMGGNVAADQVRCWTLLADLAQLDARAKSEIAPLLRLAARSHFKGEQYSDGAWGDVTIYDYGPKGNLQVGDYPGAPQNLLAGLATVYRADLGLRTAEQRALYTAVLRSSEATYLEAHGFLMDRSRQPGANPAAGSLRMMLGLAQMLKALR